MIARVYTHKIFNNIRTKSVLAEVPTFGVCDGGGASQNKVTIRIVVRQDFNRNRGFFRITGDGALERYG